MIFKKNFFFTIIIASRKWFRHGTWIVKDLNPNSWLKI